MLIQVIGSLGNIMPTQNDIVQAEKDRQTAKNNFEQQAKKMRDFDNLKKDYRTRCATYWNTNQNGNVEIVLRELVDGAARKLDMKLNSLGSVRSGKINSELNYAELDVIIVDKYENIVAFIAEIDKISPKLAWKRFDLRQEMQRPLPPGGGNSGTSGKSKSNAGPSGDAGAEDVTKFRFSGLLRVFCYESANSIAPAEGAQK
ncbi:MAG: hypothetical protein RR060_06475 [Victivallaceae bacterium]